MNVWLMMWLFDGRVNQVSKEQVILLHIDGMLNRHKFYGDKMNLFFETYNRNLKGVITANSLGNATLCVENIIFQPKGNDSLICSHPHVLTHSYAHIHTYLLTHSYAHIHTYLLTHSYAHIHTYLLTHSYAHIHTYLLTHTLTSIRTYSLIHLLTIRSKIFRVGLLDH